MAHILEKTILKGLLNYDALDEAERITGKSYKEDKNVAALGMLMIMDNNKDKNQLLTLNDDTVLCNTLENYLRIIKDEGFTVVYKEAFTTKDKDATPEFFYICWHPEGILLAFDTYNTKDVNSSHMWYNWEPNDIHDKKWYYAISSGTLHKTENVYIGSHDAREALRFHLDELRSLGKFLNPWIQRPFLWLLHYGDTQNKDYKYEKLNEIRIAKLPEEIQMAIPAW